jgi:hypothetical protein
VNDPILQRLRIETHVSIKKEVLFPGSKIYKQLPSNIKMLDNDIKHFKSALRCYLTEQAFYTMDEYYLVTSQ